MTTILKEITPKLDSLEVTATIGARTERLSKTEFLLLEHLLRFPEEQLSRDSLVTTVTNDDQWVPDRILNRQMSVLMAKLNVLHPRFPLLRRLSKDTWVYSEIPPRPKRSNT